MSSTKYDSQLSLTRDQREFLWRLTLRDETVERRKQLDKEVKEVLSFGIERFVKSSPNYKLFYKNRGFIKKITTVSLYSGNNFIENAKKEAEKILKDKHNISGTVSLYYYNSFSAVLKEPLIYIPELTEKNSSCWDSFNLSEKAINLIYTDEEKIQLQKLIAEDISLQGEDSYWLCEYDSDAGNHLGKLKTWGEVKAINETWYNILCDKFYDSSDTQDNLKRLVEKDLNKSGKSKEINNALCKLTELIKHCNLYLD